MDLGLRYAILVFAGVLIGMFIYDRFLVPEHETTYKETIVTDTTFKHYKEKYLVDSIKSKSLSDSVEFFKKKYKGILTKNNIIIVHDSVFVDKPFLAPLRRFNGQRAFLYGNTYFNATVAGELLDMEITNDFKIKTITNTITKETKTVIKPKGLYVGIMGNSNIGAGPSVDYLDNNYLFSYNYDAVNKNHSIGIKKKIF